MPRSGSQNLQINLNIDKQIIHNLAHLLSNLEGFLKSQLCHGVKVGNMISENIQTCNQSKI